MKSIHDFWLSIKWQFLLQHHKLLNQWLIITTALFVILSVGMSISEVKITVDEAGLTPVEVIRGGLFVMGMAAYFAITPYMVSSAFDVAGRPGMRLYELMRPVSPLTKHASLWLLGIIFATVGVLSALVLADVLRYLLFLLLGLHRQELFVGILWDGIRRSSEIWPLLLREGFNNAGIQQIPADEAAKIASVAANGQPFHAIILTLKTLYILAEWGLWTLCLVWAKFTFNKRGVLWGTLIYVVYAVVTHYLEQGVNAMQLPQPAQLSILLIITLLCTIYLMRQCYLLHHHQPIK